jgi:cobalt-zinc-cadmium efflux system protein
MAHDHHHEHDQPHAHSHGHGHEPQAGAGSSQAGLRAFALGTLINLGFTAVEAGYGLMTGSLALLSDALHNLGDALGLALAWGAAWLARRPPSQRRTYGYRRATVIAPLANSLLLVAASGALSWEAIRRIGAPPAVDALPVILVAAVGMVVNFGSARLFRHGHSHDINQRGAYLHLMADAAVSLAVVLGGLAMWQLGWNWLDPLLAIAVGAVVAWSSWGLLRDSLDLALDAVPRGIEPEAVRTFLAAEPGVVAVHHLHVWALGSREVALTAHLVRARADDNDAFLQRVGLQLNQRFGIGHATIQIEHGADAGCGPCANA